MNIAWDKLLDSGVALAVGATLAWLYLSLNRGVGQSASPKPPPVANVVQFVSFLGQAIGVITWIGFYLWIFIPWEHPGPLGIFLWAMGLSLGLLHALAIPMLCILVAPRDPVEQLINETQGSSWSKALEWMGFSILVFYSVVTVYTEFGKIDTVASSGHLPGLTFMLVFGTIVLPGFSWIQETNDYEWRVRRAIGIKRLRTALAHERNVMEIEFISTCMTALEDTVSPLAARAPEIIDTVEALYHRVQDGLRQVMVNMQVINKGVRLSVAQDPAIDAMFADLLEKLGRVESQATLEGPVAAAVSRPSHEPARGEPVIIDAPGTNAHETIHQKLLRQRGGVQ